MIRHDDLLEKPADLGQATAKFAAYHGAKSGIERTIPGAVWALTLLDGNGEDEPVLVRGNHRTPARELVPRSFLRRTEPGDGLADDAQIIGDTEFVAVILQFEANILEGCN